MSESEFESESHSDLEIEMKSSPSMPIDLNSDGEEEQGPTYHALGTEIGKQINQWRKFETGTGEKAFESIIDTAADLTEHAKTMGLETVGAHANELRKALDTLIDVNKFISVSRRSFERLHQTIPTAPAGSLSDLNWDQKIQETREAIMAEEPEMLEEFANKKMQEFLDAIKVDDIENISDDEFQRALRGEEEEKDDSDEDLAIIGNRMQTESIKCPLTTLVFEDPVETKACKHVFEKEAIEAVLENKGSIECPVPGCDKRIKKSDLRKSRRMIRLVKQRRRQQRVEGSDDEQLDLTLADG